MGTTLFMANHSAIAEDSFVRGSATADASSFGLALKQGAGSVGITWASSSTSYREGYAAASAKPLDMQLVRLLLGEASRCTGDTSPVPFPDKILPPEFATNTLSPTAGTAVEGGADFPGIYDTPTPGPVGRGSVVATPGGPSSTASVKANNINLIVAEIINPSTTAQTSLVGHTRVATATSRADRLSFLWGLMTIDNPTWTATVKTGGENVHQGTFTVSGGTLWGQKRTAEQAMSDLKATATFIQDLLGYIGLAMDMPATQVNGDVVSVSPLLIHLTDSPLGKEIIAPAFAAKQPDGKPTIDQSIKETLDKWASETCDNKRYRQIAEIILGLLKGSGSLELPIGGASASTDATPPPKFDPPTLDEPVVGVEGEQLSTPTYTDDVDTSDYTVDNSSSYGSDYSSSYYDDTTTEETDEPPATEATASEGDGQGQVVEFAAPIASQTKTIPGMTGGAGIAIGLVMIVLAGAAIVSERVLRARRLRKVGS